MGPAAWRTLRRVRERSRLTEGRGAVAELGACGGSRPCSVTARMARPLEQAVAAIVGTFQEYAGRRGDKHKLCQAELKELLQTELPTWTPVSTGEAAPPGAGPRPCEEGPGPARSRAWQRGRGQPAGRGAPHRPGAVQGAGAVQG